MCWVSCKIPWQLRQLGSFTNIYLFAIPKLILFLFPLNISKYHVLGFFNDLMFYIPRSRKYLWFYQLSIGFSISKLSQFTTSQKKNTTENPCNVSSKAIKRLGVPKWGAVRKPPLKSRPRPISPRKSWEGKKKKKTSENPTIW